MRIALVSHAADIHSGSRAPIELAKHFAKLGHEVIFFAHAHISRKNAINELKSTKIKVVLIDYPRIKFIDRILAAFMLATKLRKLKPDIISAHATLPFMLGSKLSGIPLFSTYHGTQTDVWLDKIFPRVPGTLDKIANHSLNFIIKSLMWFQLALSDRIITLSKYCSRELLTFYGKKAPFVYWGGAPPHLLDITLKPKKSNLITLLSVSRIVPYKGFHVLIEIVKELEKKYPNLKLTIIGSHPNKNYLSYLNKIKSKNTRIILNPNDKVLSIYYQQADLYVTCDKFLFFGMPIFEAASFAKPVIAFNSASAKEIIQNSKTGIVVSSKEEFKNALIKLMTNEKERLKLGKNAFEFNKKYTWENAARFYIKLFEKWQKH